MTATIGQMAKDYVKPLPKTIADLDQVPVNIPLHEEIVNEGQPDAWQKKYIKLEGQEYRVPLTVLEQLQEQMKAKPDLKVFKVTKKGTDKQTKYTVIPL